MVVMNIQSKEHLETELKSAADKNGGPGLLLMDFHASWCHPCKVIAPIYERLSNEHTNIRFLKINVDDNEEIAADYNVRSLPTFIFLRGAKLLDRVMGANPDALVAKIRELSASESPEPASSLVNSGSSGGGQKQQPDLMPLLSLSQCECLNEDNSHPLSSILTTGSPSGDAYLLSDTDAQLVIFVTFSQFVKLRSIQITAPLENGPRTVKLFVNQISTPDFDGCEVGKAVQSFELEPKDLVEEATLQLNFVRFQKVTTLTLFVQDNQSGSDQTRIDKLRFFGDPVTTTNMQNFVRVTGQKGEEHGGT